MGGIGSGISGGLMTGDWQESMVSGMRNSAAGYLAGNMGIESTAMSNSVNLMFRKLMGSDEEFDMTTISNVDVMSMVVQDAYKKYQQKTNPAKADTQKSGSSDRTKDPFAAVDDAISGIFVSLGRGLGQGIGEIGDAIRHGAETAWDGVTEAASYAANAVSSFAGKVWDGVTDIAQRTGNLFTEGHFASDEEVAQIREQERIQQDQEIFNGVKPVGMSEAEYKQKFKELEQKAKDAENVKQRVMVNGKEKLVNGEQKVDIKLLNQNEIGHTNCYFTSVVMLAEALMGKAVNLLDVFNIAQNTKVPGTKLNVTDSKGTVNSYEGAARAAGVDVKDGSLVSQNVTDPNKTIDTMIEQLDNKNPILIQLTGGHAEVVYGYEVVNNNLRFLVHDPGYQKDTYLDASNLQPYKDSQNYSTEKGGVRVPKYNEYRSVFRIKYFKR